MRIFLFLVLLWPFAALAQDDADLDAFLTDPPFPLDLAILGDDAMAKEAVISAKGGQLSLSNAAGDTFTLTFPEGAFLTDTTIRAIPISTSAGLPAGAGPMSGLILQPDGLELGRTAMLEITPKTAIPPESRLHWGFYGRGKDAFLHIPVQDTDAILIPIDHFSGAGISFADRVNLRLDRWRQKSIEDRLTTRVAEIFRDAKVNGDPDGEKVRSVGDLLSGEAARRVYGGWRKLTANPAANCETVETGAKAVVSLERQRNILGLEVDPENAEVFRALSDRYWQVCFPEKMDQCLSTGDLSVLVRFVFRYDKMRQLAALDPEGSAAANHEPELRDALVRCGRYKLTVTSSGRWVDPAGVYGTVDFKIEAPIRLTFSKPTGYEHLLEGEAGPLSQSLTFVDYACWKFERSYAGTPFLGRLTDMTFNLNTSAPIKVKLEMRAVELFAVISCTSKNLGTKTLDHEVVSVTWGIGHKKERNVAVYTLKDMKPGRYPKIFSRDWTGEGADDGIKASDSTTLVLEHIGG